MSTTGGMAVQLQTPGFNMNAGPAHGASERVTFTHAPGSGEHRVGQATADWMKARERLWADPDADVDDLLGSQS
jgi:hypothetical protein